MFAQFLLLRVSHLFFLSFSFLLQTVDVFHEAISFAKSKP